MSVKIELLSSKSFYTNSDDIAGVVLGTAAAIRVTCESHARINTGQAEDKVCWESLQTIENNTFSVRLPDIASKAPSTLAWPEQTGWTARSSVEWAVHALSENGKILVSVPFTFVHTSHLANVFNLREVKHVENIFGRSITGKLTFAADGIPQYPLSIGLGLNLSFDLPPSNLRLVQVRVILSEVLTVRVGKASETRVERWLIHENFVEITLNGLSSLNLNQYVGDAAVKPFLTESFKQGPFDHHFYLSIELQLEDTENSLRERMNISTPIQVLGRVTDMGPGSHVDMELAYFTDSEASEDEEIDCGKELRPRTGSSSTAVRKRLMSMSAPRVEMVQIE